MINIFRRHLDICKLRSRRDQNRCKCPIHAEGTLGGVPFRRQSLDLTSWAAAQKKVREWAAAGTTEIKPGVSLRTARDAYIADVEARRLSHSAKRHVEKRRETGPGSRRFVLVKRLNEQVKRNGDRFPEDFMFFTSH